MSLVHNDIRLDLTVKTMANDKVHIRHCILFAFQLNKNLDEAVKMICSALGQDAVTHATCKKWYQRFQEGNFELYDRPRCSCSKKFDDNLELILDENTMQTQKQIMEQLTAGQKVISNRLRENLRKQGNWQPPEINTDDKTVQLDSVLANISPQTEGCMKINQQNRENLIKYTHAGIPPEAFLYKNGESHVFIKQELEFDELASKFNIGHFMSSDGEYFNNQNEGSERSTVTNGQNPQRGRRKGRERHMCQYCNKYFSSISYLRMHIRTHTGQEPYVCSTCNKSFVRFSSLKVHRVTHTHERPYVCDTCDKAFARPSDLTRHKRTHTGEKRFACNTCHKRFTEAGSLHTHTRIHTGETPYVCNLCDKRFSRLDHLKKHRRTEHRLTALITPGVQ